MGAGPYGVVDFWQRLEPAAFFAAQHILPFKFSQQIWELGQGDGIMRWLSFIETFLGTSLFAFFLLALRRRFKR